MRRNVIGNQVPTSEARKPDHSRPAPDAPLDPLPPASPADAAPAGATLKTRARPSLRGGGPHTHGDPENRSRSNLVQVSRVEGRAAEADPPGDGSRGAALVREAQAARVAGF